MVYSISRDKLYNEAAEILFLEALGNLAAVPSGIRKLVTSPWGSGLAGENSEVVKIASGVKNFGQLQKLLRQGVKASENYVMAWVEIDGEFIAGIKTIGAGVGGYNLFFPDGSNVTKTQRETVRGTDKWDRKLQKYIPPRYWEYQRRDMKLTEAVEALYGAVYGMYEAAKEQYGADVDNFISSKSFSAMAITVDKNRIALRQQRTADKAPSVQDQQLELQRAAIKKLIKTKLGPLIAKVRSSIPDEETILAAIEDANFNRRRLPTINMKELEENMKKLNEVVQAANYALTSSSPVSKNFDGKPEVSWSLKSLLKVLNDI